MEGKKIISLENKNETTETIWGFFPYASEVKKICCQYKRHRFNLWVRKSPWKMEMATKSNIFAYRILWIEESGELQSMGLKRS